MKIITTSLTFFALFLCSTAYSQVYYGFVKDLNSKQGIPYVNIALLGTYSGTVSKYDGSFRLDLSDKIKGKDSIAFSIIGYERKIVSVNSLKDSSEIFMTPTSVTLESVIVSPKSPEEYIQLAIEKIPENYIAEPFNGTIYYRSILRLNGKFIESQEAIMKGYIMPVVSDLKDTTRLKMLAYKYYDEQEDALNSIKYKKRKKEKVALEGLDSGLIELTYQLSEAFGVYTQIDSNAVKELHEKGHQKGKEKYWFENMVLFEGRNLMTIGFKGRLDMASQRGNLLLDEESLAFAKYNIQIGTSNLKIKTLALLFGIGFKRADAVIRFTSIPSEKGWIPDVMDVNIYVDMEKNRWFKKDIPIEIELSTHMSFLDIETPATDDCKSGRIVKKKKHLKEQFKSSPSNKLWSEYQAEINRKSVK